MSRNNQLGIFLLLMSIGSTSASKMSGSFICDVTAYPDYKFEIESEHQVVVHHGTGNRWYKVSCKSDPTIKKNVFCTKGKIKFELDCPTVINQCSTDKYPNHIFKNEVGNTIITGSIDDSQGYLVNCLDDLTEQLGTKFTCRAASFSDSENRDLLEVLPCPLELEDTQYSEWFPVPDIESKFVNELVEGKRFQVRTDKKIDGDNDIRWTMRGVGGEKGFIFTTDTIEATHCSYRLTGTEGFLKRAGVLTFLKTTTQLQIWFDGVVEVIWVYEDKENGKCTMKKEMTGLRFRDSDKVSKAYRYQTGITSTGWRDVAKGKAIDADLDKVTLQIKTSSRENGKVEIRNINGLGEWQSTIEWSTNPSVKFELQGTCGRNNYIRHDTQIPESKLLVWMLKKEGNLIIINCNQREVYKYDFIDNHCTQFNSFHPRIEFSDLDTASIMYKIIHPIQAIGKRQFTNLAGGWLY